MVPNKSILYVASVFFPYGMAYSTRLKNFARLFTTIGYKVHIIADYTKDSDILLRNIHKYENFTYEILGENTRYYRYILSKQSALNSIKEYIKNNNVSHIIIPAGDTRRYTSIKEICKKNNIKFILEICEWYNKTSFIAGSLDPRYLYYNNYMNKYFYSADGIITISRYLEKHFAQKNKHVIRIPTILDTCSSEYSTKTHNERIRLIYAGTIRGNKESFYNILLALKRFGVNCPFEYYVYGGSYLQILENIGNNKALLDSLNGIVFCQGIIPQTEVHQAFLSADYEVFLRPNRRSSQAGFPTKLAEGMVAGTPIITNNTGDIGLYLANEENGFLLNDDSPDAIEKVLCKIVSMSHEECKLMRFKARKTAEECFDYRIYSNLINDFLEELGT